MKKESKMANVANDIEATEVAMTNGANEAKAQPCCPKAKTTVLAIIEGEEAQNFIVVIEDNFGNAFELEFDFNDDTPTEQEETEQVMEGGETANG